MKNINRIILAALLAYTNLMLIGCSKPDDQLDPKWTSPVAVFSSIAGLGGAARVLKYQDTVVGVQSLGNGSAKLFFLNRPSNSWSEVPISVPKGYLWGYAAIDPQSRRTLLPQGYAENEQLVMSALIGSITEGVGLRDITERTWITDKKTLLGETGPKVKLNAYAKREGIELGSGILNGSDVYVPYCFHATTFFGINNASNGPFNNGVFYSADSGKTWQIEKISDLNAIAPAICKTTGRFYYFAGDYPLWFSRKPSEGGKWEEPQAITKTFAMVFGHFDVVGEGDTAHICWLDRRHNKWRFNIDAPPIENNEIFYRRQKDADQGWGKEVLLSKGLLYAYAPTISAEGDNVVVTWAGIQTADKQHMDMGPNDIYYVTSKDGGKTWTKPLKVTDGVKDGITSGMPEVMLFKGVIHLFYIQGKRESQQLSPGLTKLNQPPWPIYYTQRPFPN